MTPPPSNQSFLQAQINALGETVSQGFAKLESMLNNIEERVRAIETAEAGAHPLINSRLDAVWKKVDQHESDIKTLRNDTDKQLASIRDDMNTLKATNRILSWLGGLLGTSLIAWFLSQIFAVIK